MKRISLMLAAAVTGCGAEPAEEHQGLIDLARDGRRDDIDERGIDAYVRKIRALARTQ
jgi:hypothetical protein